MAVHFIKQVGALYLQGVLKVKSNRGGFMWSKRLSMEQLKSVILNMLDNLNNSYIVTVNFHKKIIEDNTTSYRKGKQVNCS